jgi:hypothetical protein
MDPQQRKKTAGTPGVTREFVPLDERFVEQYDPNDENNLLYVLTNYAPRSGGTVCALGRARGGVKYFVSDSLDGLRLYATKTDSMSEALLLDDAACDALFAALQARASRRESARHHVRSVQPLPQSGPYQSTTLHVSSAHVPCALYRKMTLDSTYCDSTSQDRPLMLSKSTFEDNCDAFPSDLKGALQYWFTSVEDGGPDVWRVVFDDIGDLFEGLTTYNW